MIRNKYKVFKAQKHSFVCYKIGHIVFEVPQGLGPLLFLILMIDIWVLNANVVSFVDDTRLYSKIS